MKKTVWIINQYASTPDTGIGGRHYYIAKELADIGYDVYLITSANHHLLRNPPEISQSVKIEKNDGFNVVWVKTTNYKNAHNKKRVFNWFFFSWRIRALYRLIKNKPSAIIYSSPSPIGFLGAKMLASKLNSKLIFEVRDIWPLTLIEVGGYSPKHPFIRFMQWVEDKAYRDSDSVISNLKNSVEHMVSRGMQKDKFLWIPNGFSLKEVKKRIPLNDETRALLPKGKFIIGYTGTLGVANALDTLLQAAKGLKDNTCIHFVLVGEGKEKDNLKSYVLENSLNNVTFLDSIPKVEIQAMLSYFDCCYLGLTKDPLFRFGVSPNKLFDYMYSGKPVIYAIESGKYNPIEDSGAGIKVEPENPKQLIDGIIKIKSLSEKDRQKMGENGRQLVTEEYEYGKLAKKMVHNIFDRI